MMNLNDELIDILKGNIILQAKYFLTEAGEFYPFGAAIDSNNEVKPIGLYLGNEHPDSNEVINMLGKALWEGLQKGSYKFVGMGIDIYLPGTEKESALEVRIMNIDGLITKIRLPYYFSSTRILQFKETILVE